MATTTNYGWTTPNDTDLVKDGASAMRTLGSSIDTTVKSLNPETTLGDISYRSSTANTKTRLAIGTTGQVLTVSGGVPAWASLSTSGPAFAATLSADQTISQNTYTKVAFDTETFDTNNNYNTTDRRFTPTQAGYYLIGLGLGMIQNSGFMYGTIYKNGTMDSIVYMTETDAAMHHSKLIYFNGTTDYVEAYARLNGGGQLKIFTGASSSFYGYFVRS